MCLNDQVLIHLDDIRDIYVITVICKNCEISIYLDHCYYEIIVIRLHSLMHIFVHVVAMERH